VIRDYADRRLREHYEVISRFFTLLNLL
jgi:hypothetical protein